MVTSDVEMEDAEKKDHESGNNIAQESESEGLDVNIQSNGGNISSADMVAGDVSRTEDGEEGVLKERGGVKEEMNVKCETNELVQNKNDTSETKEVDGSNGKQIFKKIEDKEAKMDDQVQDAAEKSAQNQNDANNGVVGEKSAGREVEETADESGMGCGNLDDNTVEENTNGEIAAENPDCIGHVAGEDLSTGNDVTVDNQAENNELPSDKDSLYQNGQSCTVEGNRDNGMGDTANVNEGHVVKDEPKEQNNVLLATPVADGHEENVATVSAKREVEDSSVRKQTEFSTPSSAVRYYSAAGEHGSGTAKTVYTQATLPLMAEDDNGTPEEQAVFMKEVESFYRERAIDFKPPKFYGQPLNCLKLWRAVIRLGGYDRVTTLKLWRQVGESFHPPKTCTTVSWTFRIFYEKSLLEFERHKIQSGEVQLPILASPEASGADIEGNGYQVSGRAKRDSAARAMQGWHAQHLFTNGEDKSLSSMAKREKGVKGSLKQKRPNEVDHPVKAARTEASRQLAVSVVDIGPPAEWVKVNVRQTKDCFEVYALVPGLLREEVRVQSDPAGRLVITGQPEQVDNPWGIHAFKKVVSLPGRIDPLQTSAVVSLHGRLSVKVPFEKPNINQG